jgi:hypothetical protein
MLNDLRYRSFEVFVCVCDVVAGSAQDVSHTVGYCSRTESMNYF